MIASFSRTQFPNGGWIFHDPRTGFTAPTPKGSTFGQTVELIIKDRRKNPAIVIKHKLPVDVEGVSMELEQFTRRRCGIPNNLPTPPSILLPGMAGAAVSGVSEIKLMALGTALMVSWEKSGDPAVEREEFNDRGTVCSTCPMNDLAKFEDWRKSPIGSVAIMKTTRIQAVSHKAKLPIQLGLCRGLFCPTQYLASMPMERLRSRLKEAEVAGTDASCWLRNG